MAGVFVLSPLSHFAGSHLPLSLLACVALGFPRDAETLGSVSWTLHLNLLRSAGHPLIPCQGGAEAKESGKDYLRVFPEGVEAAPAPWGPTPHGGRGVHSHPSHGQVELCTLGTEVEAVSTQLVRQERAERKPLALGACGGTCPKPWHVRGASGDRCVVWPLLTTLVLQVSAVAVVNFRIRVFFFSFLCFETRSLVQSRLALDMSVYPRMTLNTPGWWGAGDQTQGFVHARQALPIEPHHTTSVLNVVVNRENPPPGCSWGVEMKLCVKYLKWVCCGGRAVIFFFF